MIGGKTPFIGASDSNNGVTAFISNENESEDENFLSVSYNGSVCECFYQQYKCLCSDDVKRFHLKNRVGNEYIYLFLAKTINQQKNKYNYGYKFNEQRMRRQKIMLPVDLEGKPDFEYMETYIRLIEEEILQKYREYVAEMENYPVISPDKKIWQSFRLLDYFDFIKGDQNDMTTLNSGDLPLISAKNANNGLKSFVSDNGKKIFSGHCITLNNDGDGGAGIAYYQPANFLLDTHVTALYPKIELSRETLLFISTCITNQREKKFAFRYTVTNRRLNMLKVNFPINDAGEPDFDYMGKLIRIYEKNSVERYLNYINGEI